LWLPGAGFGVHMSDRGAFGRERRDSNYREVGIRVVVVLEDQDLR
jgi:hypothetical protein